MDPMWNAWLVNSHMSPDSVNVLSIFRSWTILSKKHIGWQPLYPYKMAENTWVIGVKFHPTYRGPHVTPFITGDFGPTLQGSM